MSQVDFVAAIATPEYLRKYGDTTSDPVVDAELRLIGTRLRKRAAERQRLVPLLLSGDPDNRVSATIPRLCVFSLRFEKYYFAILFGLFLVLYSIPFDHPKVDEFRDAFKSGSA